MNNVIQLVYRGGCTTVHRWKADLLLSTYGQGVRTQHNLTDSPIGDETFCFVKDRAEYRSLR